MEILDILIPIMFIVLITTLFVAIRLLNNAYKRIDKAIEYLEEAQEYPYWGDYTIELQNDLLQILKGDTDV